MKRSREKAERQGHGASLLDDDDDDEDEDTGDDKKDLEVLQCIPDVFKKSGDGAELSGAGSTVRAVDKDGAMREHSALSPPQGLRPKCSRTIDDVAKVPSPQSLLAPPWQVSRCPTIRGALNMRPR
jgi:hypothetical protein